MAVSNLTPDAAFKVCDVLPSIAGFSILAEAQKLRHEVKAEVEEIADRSCMVKLAAAPR